MAGASRDDDGALEGGGPAERFQEPEAPRSWGCISAALLVALAFAPSGILIARYDASFLHAAMGAATWAVAVLLKKPLAIALRAAMPNGGMALASLQGLLSALLELGAAAAWLWRWPDLSAANVIAFGAAAGSAEVLYVLGAGAVAPRRPEVVEAWMRGAAVSLCVRYSTPIERAFALVGHTGSRGLIHLALHGQVVLAPVALVLFSAIDAVAYYGHLRGWNWFAPRLCRRAHAFFASCSVVEVTLFAAALTQ